MAFMHSLLEALASRTIVELLVHNFPDKESLNNKLTARGFAVRERLSDDYRHFDISLRVEPDI